jgi:hypothetical protein
MPYFQNAYDPDKDLQGQATAQAQGPGAPAAVPAVSGSAPAAAPAQGQQQGPRFVNFSDRFAANRDAADRTSKALQQSVAAKGQAAQTAADDAWGAFKKAAGGQQPQRTPQTWQQAASTPQGPGRSGGVALPPKTAATPPPVSPWSPGSAGTGMRTGGPGRTFSVQDNPGPGGMSDSQLQQAAQQQYGGPSGLSDMPGFGDLVAQVSDAATRAGLAGSSEGRQALLSEQNGTRGGASRLDEALVSAGGAAPWAQLKQRFGGLGDTLGRYGAAATTLAGQTKAGIDTSRAAAQQELDRRAEVGSAKATLDSQPLANAPASAPATDTQPGPGTKTIDTGFGNKLTVNAPKSGLDYDKQPPSSFGNGNFKDYAEGSGPMNPGILYNHADAVAVWNSLTPAEVNAFFQGHMSTQEKYQFILDRAKALGLKGY